MRENEFEKRVREKMDQWGFEPSASVWAGVDKEINKKKKRRVPLFWLFFISGLLLAGGAYQYISTKNTTGIIPARMTEKEVSQIPEKKTNTEKQIPQRDPALSEPEENSKQEKNASTGNFHKQPPVTGIFRANKKPIDPRNADAQGNRPFPEKRMTETKRTNETNPALVGAGDIVVNNYSDQSTKTSAEKDNKRMADSAAAKMIAGTTATKTKKDSVTAATTAKVNDQKKNSSGWEIGYTVGLGSSNLNQNLFNSVKTLSPVVNSNLSAAPPGNGGNTNSSSSDIHPGFSFDAGAFVTKSLSKRISFSAGISYHYYSTTIATGMKINTTLATYNNMGQAVRATSYYENDNSQTFTNQYHIIEMPVSANFQLNKSKRIPLIWEMGLTPGYIISSNALYYDPNTNVYFKNYLQPNKMQLNGVTAIMIGIPVNIGQLQAGPQVQYGFTGFVNTNDGNPGHLFYAGLKISFIPGKK